MKPKKTSSPPSKMQGKTKLPNNYDATTFNLPDIDLHVLAPKDISKYYGDSKNPNQKSFASVSMQINECLAWLYERAAIGETSAVNTLADLGTEAAYFLDQLEVKQPDFIKGISRRRIEWPTFLTSDTDNLKKLAKQQRRLELGKAIQIRPDKIKFRGKNKIQREVIYCCLDIFSGMSAVVAARRRCGHIEAVHQLFARADVASSNPILSALFEEEFAQSKRRIELVTTRVKTARRMLSGILNISQPSPYIATEKVSKSLQDSTKLPALSPTSAKGWFDLVVEFLVAFIGNNLEENIILRQLGDHRGDVEIRRLSKKMDSRDFASMKMAMRRNQTVNKAIRYRIVEKLQKAMDEFVDSK